ncbi:MAG TPA: HEAT repeat domain-containing protein [Gemmatimonadales bacterium]|jgi:HEAT repeat protein|nr:HEAT repeat domain-containing protein [Gemmatimonadales bacterium]
MKRVLILSLLAALLLASRAGAQAEPQLTNDTTWEGRPLSAWIEDLKGQAPYTRHRAAYTISSLGPHAKAAVPALIEALKDPVRAVRYAAAYALSEIGPGASDAIPALTETLDDPDDDVAFMAKKAIKKIQSTGTP